VGGTNYSQLPTVGYRTAMTIKGIDESLSMVGSPHTCRGSTSVRHGTAVQKMAVLFFWEWGCSCSRREIVDQWVILPVDWQPFSLGNGQLATAKGRAGPAGLV